jgi:RNA polymerase sigma factor (sigma-70 family)
MGRSGVGSFLGYLRGLAAPAWAGGLTDGQLLSAYCVQHDQAAFAALVQRHGSLVMAVCGRVLAHDEDREDAFQATFLALARDAASVRQRESVAGWLHGVARHIALTALRAAARRKKHEDQAMTTPARNPAWEAAWREVQVVLDEEIQRLPDKYREPFVLCCLENQSRGEAAARLGLKEGTVGSRLTEARRRLRQRLALRGVELAAVLGASAVAAGTATAHVPAALVATLTSAVAQMASGKALSSDLVSAHILHLIQGGPRAMFSTKTTIGTILVLAMSAVASGLGVVAYRQLAADAAEARPRIQIPQAEDEARLPPRAGTSAKPGPVAAKGGRAVWKEKAAFEALGWLIASVAYSQDGKLLVVGGTGGHVVALDPATRKEKWKAEVEQGFDSLTAVAFAADKKSILATFGDGARFLDAGTGKLGAALEEKDSNPSAIGVFPDKVVSAPGNRTVTGHKVIFANARGCFVKTWLDSAPASTITTRTADRQPADPHAVPLAVDPNGRSVIVTGPIDRNSGKNVLWAWVAGDSEPGSPGNRLLTGHEAVVVSAAWSRDGKTAVTGDASGRVIVWDAQTMKEAHRLELGARVAAVAVSPDGKNTAAVAIGERAEFYLWETTKSDRGKPLHTDARDFSGGRIHACLAFSPNGRQLAGSAINMDWLSRAGELIGKLWVWELEPAKSGQ